MNAFQVKKDLNARGITIRKKPSTGEYRVNFVGGTEESAYYSDDLKDAYYTGLDMAKRRGGGPQPRTEAEEKKEVELTKKGEEFKIRPGAYHRATGIPQGEKIPMSRINADIKKGGKIGRMARSAKGLKAMHKKGESESYDANGYPYTRPIAEEEEAKVQRIRNSFYAVKKGYSPVRLTGNMTLKDVDWSKQRKQPPVTEKEHPKGALGTVRGHRTTKPQQKLFGIARGMQHGETPKSYSPQAAEISRELSGPEVHKIASKPKKGYRKSPEESLDGNGYPYNPVTEKEHPGGAKGTVRGHKTTKKQQQLFGIARGMQKGKTSASYSPQAAKIAGGMSSKETKKVASKPKGGHRKSPSESYRMREAGEDWRGPKPGGQGEHPSRGAEHPLYPTLSKHGYKYSHTTPIRGMGGETHLRHTFQHPANPEHKVGLRHDKPGSWETSTSPASGRQMRGSGAEALGRHLGHKARRYRLRSPSESSQQVMVGNRIAVGDKKRLRHPHEKKGYHPVKTHHEPPPHFGPKKSESLSMTQVEKKVMDLVYAEEKRQVSRNGVSEMKRSKRPVKEDFPGEGEPEGGDIVQFDVDEAQYIGDGDDGVYYQVGQGPDGWYMTAVVDSETSHYTETIIKDDGPYKTEAEAQQAGSNAAHDWCMDMGVNTSEEEIIKVRDIPEGCQFVSDSQDVEPIQQHTGTDYDSYFVKVGEGDYEEIYGMYGIVPNLSKDVYKVL